MHATTENIHALFHRIIQSQKFMQIRGLVKVFNGEVPNFSVLMTGQGPRSWMGRVKGWHLPTKFFEKDD